MTKNIHNDFELVIILHNIIVALKKLISSQLSKTCSFLVVYVTCLVYVTCVVVSGMCDMRGMCDMCVCSNVKVL